MPGRATTNAKAHGDITAWVNSGAKNN